MENFSKTFLFSKFDTEHLCLLMETQQIKKNHEEKYKFKDLLPDCLNFKFVFLPVNRSFPPLLRDCFLVQGGITILRLLTNSCSPRFPLSKPQHPPNAALITAPVISTSQIQKLQTRKSSKEKIAVCTLSAMIAHTIQKIDGRC